MSLLRTISLLCCCVLAVPASLAQESIGIPTPGSRPPPPPRVVDPKLLEAPVDVAAVPAESAKTKSGLASKVLQAGSGAVHPKRTDRVTVHYTGWTTDGKCFDSSHKRGKPSTFGLSQVIPGWTEGLQLMVEGEKRRLWIPGYLAYDGKPGRPQGLLVFDVELIKIEGQP